MIVLFTAVFPDKQSTTQVSMGGDTISFLRAAMSSMRRFGHSGQLVLTEQEHASRLCGLAAAPVCGFLSPVTPDAAWGRYKVSRSHYYVLFLQRWRPPLPPAPSSSAVCAKWTILIVGGCSAGRCTSATTCSRSTPTSSGPATRTLAPPRYPWTRPLPPTWRRQWARRTTGTGR